MKRYGLDLMLINTYFCLEGLLHKLNFFLMSTDMKYFPLTFSPEHANMMGGTLVNITGPCFETGFSLSCQFDTTSVEGHILDSNTALCITPPLYVSGYVDFSISLNKGPYYWRGRFFIGNLWLSSIS